MAAKRRLFLWLGIPVVLAVLVIGRRIGTEEAPAAEPPASAAQPLEVATRVVAPRALIERFSTVGTVQADEQIEVRSEISGVIAEVSFVDGARVRRGDVLVRLEDGEYVAERNRALHRVELARLREARQQDLLAQGLTAQDEYDLALSQLNVLTAELELAEVELAKTRIRAAFDGVVGLRQVSPGATLTPQTRIATLQKIDTVKIEFAVPEGYAARTGPGEMVTFRVRGTAEGYQARIFALEPNVDPETRSLRARARCANPGGALLPGSFADVELAIREIADALTVPALAVIPELGSKKVFVLEDGRAVPRFVETGVRTADEVQITSGLEPGDRVIVTGVQQLSSGREVIESGAS